VQVDDEGDAPGRLGGRPVGEDATGPDH
jgi:hypothetical protein